MKDMSFCSLNEAWGGSQGCQPNALEFNPDTSPTIKNENREIVNINDNLSQMRFNKQMNDGNNLTPEQVDHDIRIQNAVLNEHQNKINRICELLMSHLETCSSCRRNLELRFGKQSNTNIEQFAPYRQSPNYIEILMIILVGVFVIIMMDSFLKFGKRLN